jgi:hypothetical protein
MTVVMRHNALQHGVMPVKLEIIVTMLQPRYNRRYNRRYNVSERT